MAHILLRSSAVRFHHPCLACVHKYGNDKRTHQSDLGSKPNIVILPNRFQACQRCCCLRIVLEMISGLDSSPVSAEPVYNLIIYRSWILRITLCPRSMCTQSIILTDPAFWHFLTETEYWGDIDKHRSIELFYTHFFSSSKCLSFSTPVLFVKLNHFPSYEELWQVRPVFKTRFVDASERELRSPQWGTADWN